MAAELFGPADVPKTVGLPDLRSQDLTAEEGFLLSRIDGRTNVKGLLALVSWDKDKTLALLESLLRKHLVNFDRAAILDTVAPPTQTQGTPGPTAAPAATSAAPAPVVDRSRLEKVPDLDEDRCAEIMAWVQGAEVAQSLYELFRIPDGADAKSVKREYRQLAMKFHPDKFFRKEIGGYRRLIEETWKRIQEAYEKLTDAEQKAAYDTELLARGPRPTLSPTASPVAAPPPAASPAKPWMAPPPPPSPASAGGSSQPLPQVPQVDPRPKLESAFERKIRQEVKERVERAKACFDQAQADFKDKKYLNADSNLKMALQFDPKNEEYLKWYGSVKAVLEENIVQNNLRKAELAELSHDAKGAQDEYERALNLFPDNPAANRAMGLFLLGKGDPNLKRIRECLQKAVQAKPKDLEALVGLAKALRFMGMFKNAQRVLEQAKELDSKDARVVEEAKELKRAAK